jgi:hypothetical protein
MITIQKWSGLVTNASPYALPGGACVVQNNLQCIKPGQIQCRNGMITASTAMGRVFSMAKLAAGTSVIFHSGTAIVISSVT